MTPRSSPNGASGSETTQSEYDAAANRTCPDGLSRAPIAGVDPARAGYDRAMSESTPEPGDDDQMITDEMLPDDLNAEKNPLARDPDDDSEGGISPQAPDAPGPPAGPAGG